MNREARTHTLGDFARIGFRQLSESRSVLTALAAEVRQDSGALLDAFVLAADPDAALTRVSELNDHHPGLLTRLSVREWRMLALLFGASPALGSFFVRRPGRLGEILAEGGRLVSNGEARRELL